MIGGAAGEGDILPRGQGDGLSQQLSREDAALIVGVDHRVQRQAGGAHPAGEHHADGNRRRLPDEAARRRLPREQADGSTRGAPLKLPVRESRGGKLAVAEDFAHQLQRIRRVLRRVPIRVSSPRPSSCLTPREKSGNRVDRR